MKVEFLASLPDIQSAIKVGAGQLRFQLDVPESELHKALPVTLLNGRVLKVTIEVEDSDDDKS